MNLLYLQQQITSIILEITKIQIKDQKLAKIRHVCHYLWSSLWESHEYIYSLDELNSRLLKLLIPHILTQMKIKKQYLSDIESPFKYCRISKFNIIYEDNPLYVIYYF